MKLFSRRFLSGAAASFALLSGVVAPFHAVQIAHAAPGDGSDVATDKIKDLQLTLAVVNEETDFKKLKKIGGAFATTYRAKRALVFYKNPNKARFETKIIGATAAIVYNGDTKLFKTPFGSKKESTKGQPGQKQTLMDLGIFAKDYITTDYKPTLLRKEGSLLVFKMTQRDTGNKSHEVIWVNPKNAIIEKRQSFNGDSVLQKELRYKNPALFPGGVWVPARVEVYNQFGELGAVQRVEDVRLNKGIDDAKFSTL